MNFKRKYSAYNPVWGVYALPMTSWLTPSGLERIPVHQIPEIRKTVFAVLYYNALSFYRVTMSQINA